MTQAVGDIINSISGFFEQKDIDKEKAKEARISQKEFEQAQNLKNIEFENLLKQKEAQVKQKELPKNIKSFLSARDISSLHQEKPIPPSLSNFESPLYRTSQEQYNLKDLDLTPLERARYRQAIDTNPVNQYIKRTQFKNNIVPTTTT